MGEIFRREGYEVETGSQEHPDGNIDLVITKGAKRTVVQCKRWQSWDVGVDEIRKFAGTLLLIKGLRGASVPQVVEPEPVEPGPCAQLVPAPVDVAWLYRCADGRAEDQTVILAGFAQREAQDGPPNLVLA